MQKLALRLRSGGYDLEQIKRIGDCAVYRQTGDKGRLIAFELIKIKRAKAQEIYGKQYPERETYPSNEDFGSLAWSLAPDTTESELDRRLSALAS